MARQVRCANWERHEAQAPTDDGSNASKFWYSDEDVAYAQGWRRDGSDLLCPVCVRRIKERRDFKDMQEPTVSNLNFN